MDKFEQHRIAREAADKSRIEQAKKWLAIVNKMYDGSAEAERELTQAKSRLQQAYDEADFHHENEDEISQIRDTQSRLGKNQI